MFARNRKAGCLGRKVDRDDGRNVGGREFISRNERNIGESGVEVRIEIPDALLAPFDQRRDLIVIMRRMAGTSPIAVPSSSTSVGTTRRGLIPA